MTTPRFVMAALAATLLSTAGLAAPPSASQVSVPADQVGAKHQGKMQALFESPDQFMMFRVQMHEATKGMPHDQKKAYRKAQLQKIKAMTVAERGGYLHQLQAKWNALPVDRRTKIAAKMERHAARHEQGGGHHHGHHHDNQPGPDGGQDDQMDQSR